MNPYASDTVVTGSWWGYAEADPLVVGVVVAVVVIVAIAYVVTRVIGRRKDASRPGADRRRARR